MLLACMFCPWTLLFINLACIHATHTLAMGSTSHLIYLSGRLLFLLNLHQFCKVKSVNFLTGHPNNLCNFLFVFHCVKARLASLAAKWSLRSPMLSLFNPLPLAQTSDQMSYSFLHPITLPPTSSPRSSK